ncbi:MAG: NAD-glutamate dehydrogenase domain-containing protein [Gammaproteobacteria bacterium]
MGFVQENTRDMLFERVFVLIEKKWPESEAKKIKDFAKRYYQSISTEDLSNRNSLDLYGAVLSHWQYLQERNLGEPKIRCFNPQVEQQGWQSVHSIIEIVCNEMPFLLESIRIALTSMEINIHLIVNLGNLSVIRNEQGIFQEFNSESQESNKLKQESLIHIEIDRQSEPFVLDAIVKKLKLTFDDVKVAVQDWPLMRKKVYEIIQEIVEEAKKIELLDLKESIEFLEWLANNNFTFLGYHSNLIQGKGVQKELKLVENSALGILKGNQHEAESHSLALMNSSAKKFFLSKKILILGKSNTKSTIHRSSYLDFISIKIFNSDGSVSGEHRFVGLYTAGAYNSSLEQIPISKHKLDSILKRSGFGSGSHETKNLLNILENIPRDDFFQAEEENILEVAMGIMYLQERQNIKLFIIKDVLGRFFSCFIYVPRESFNSNLRIKMQEILMEAFHGVEISYAIKFSDSVLARLHMVVRVKPLYKVNYDLNNIEKRLISASRTWAYELEETLKDQYGEERGNELLKIYKEAFPAGYREAFNCRVAAIDIKYLEELKDENSLGMSLYRPIEEEEHTLKFKLYRIGDKIPLSDVVPILENMGLKIISERPYQLKIKNKGSVWLNDYKMVLELKSNIVDIDQIKNLFQDAFAAVWERNIENDGFNKLVLNAFLSAREITVLRAYAKYLWQIGFGYSQSTIEETMANNPEAAKLLVKLFYTRFLPDQVENIKQKMFAITEEVSKLLENISSLTEDRILRKFMNLIYASIRTNYFHNEINSKSLLL